MSGLVKRFYEDYPDYVDAMKDTCHHANRYVLRESDGSEIGLNPYHLEGDVWTHTMMVVNHAMNVIHLSPGILEVLELSTLLHDLGKIATRKRSTTHPNRIHFHGHAGVSAHMALGVMRDWGISLSVQRDVFQTISLHHSFMDMLEPFTEETSQKVGRKFRHVHESICGAMMLFHQMACDGIGRIDTTHETSIESVGFAMEQWKEMSIHHTSLPMPLTGKPPNTVTVMIGLPASGKTTYAKKLGIPIISRDNIVMELGKSTGYEECWEGADQKAVDKTLEKKLVSLKRLGDDFVVDMTNVSPKSRRRSLHGLGGAYHKKAVVMATGSREVYARNFKRKAEGKILDVNVLHKMMMGFTVPMYDEFDEIVYVFPNGEEVS